MSRTTTQPDLDAQILALVAAQAASRASLAKQAETVATSETASFRGWYDSAEITGWAAGMAQRVEPLQRATAQSTDAYLARVLSTLTGNRVRPVGRVDVSSLRQGVTHAGAYARAADVYRWQQAEWDRFARALPDAPSPQPPTIVDPIDAAVQRVMAVVDMDIQLADRAQTTAIYQRASDKGLVTGYRRVIHPELSEGGSCGLCILASDRLYGAHEPKPVHDRCKCTTLPVARGVDPGSTLNAADLKRLYKEAGSTGQADLKATRYRIDDHGELGPLLTKVGARSRTAQRARRDTNPAKPAKSAAERRETAERVLVGLEAALPRARELAARDPKQWTKYRDQIEGRVADLRRELAA